MVLGTPLSSSATRVMLLGAGELGKETIVALQRLGVETIAVDRYANAPGHQVAHRAHVVAINDPAALRRIVEQERPAIVVPEIDAIASEALVDIEAAGLAKIVPGARATQLATNREAMRRLAAETLRLPTSSYRVVDTAQALQSAIDGTDGGLAIGYPCIVKPVMSSSGKGQSVVRAAPEVPAAWQSAQSQARVRGGPSIVEAFVRFDVEVTLLAVRAADERGVVQTHFCDPIGHVQAGGDYVESWQPHPMSARALARGREIARAVTDELGGIGVFGVELFVRGDEVWFSEASPRPCDTGMVTMCTQRLSEFELHARVMLGLPVDVSLRSPGASAVIYGGLDARSIRYDGVAAALAVPETDLRLFGKPESYRRRRMGVALATGADVETAKTRARECASRVRPIA